MEKMSIAVSKQWTRVSTLGRGASGAEVFLAADDVSGELFAVKSACASGAAALRREQAIMSALPSPRVVSCIGGRDGRDGSYQLFLELAPGGSLADKVARTGGLEERAVRAYAADVARGLAYIHGESMVHGDVKARNILIGADGRAKLADFGVLEEGGHRVDHRPHAGVHGTGGGARGGTGPSSRHLGAWLHGGPDGRRPRPLERQASDRCTATQLLEHPFLASAVADAKLQCVESKWVSPKSTLDAAFWESESDTEDADDELSVSTAERMKALACPASVLPDWDSDEGWIDVLSAASETQDGVAVPAEEATDLDDAIMCQEPSGALSGA